MLFESEIFYYIILGILAGLSAGLFGIGGGIILVPGFDYVFSWFLPIHLVMPMSIATSLAVIFLSTLAAMLIHVRHKKNEMHVFKLIPFIFLGTWLGSFMVSEILSHWVRVLFAGALLYYAFYSWWPKTVHSSESTLGSREVCLLVILVSFIGSLFGIGGGLIMMPYLLSKKIPLSSALAQTTLVTMLIAAFGCIHYIGFGLFAETEVAASVGYIYLPAFLVTFAPSMLFAAIGVRLSKLWAPEWLNKIYAIILIGLAWVMIYRAWLSYNNGQDFT